MAGYVEITLKDFKKEIEVVDLRSLSPLDEETILESVKKTNRCLVVHEDKDDVWLVCGGGGCREKEPSENQ